jgi:hypothetical protein
MLHASLSEREGERERGGDVSLDREKIGTHQSLGHNINSLSLIIQ